MADGFTADVDADKLIQDLDQLGDFARTYLNEASGESAESIEHEAESRLRRQLGPNATGQTEAGIESRPALDGDGYVVLSENTRMPMLPRWIDRGTKKGKPGSHSEPARPYFDVSVELEQGAHLRRIDAAVQQAIRDKGLGE